MAKAVACDPDGFTGHWASRKDRSPVRRYYTKGIVRVLYRVALNHNQALIKANRSAEAENALRWCEDFEKKTERGLVSAEEIARLRNSADQNLR